MDCVRLSQSMGSVNGPLYDYAANLYNSITVTQLFTVSLFYILGPLPTLIGYVASKMNVLLPPSSMNISSGLVQDTDTHSCSPLRISAP